MLKEVYSQAEDLLKEHILDEKVIFQPAREEYGDFATNVCFSLARKLKKPPQAIAEDIVSKLNLPSGFIEKAEAKNGFINFFIDYKTLSGELLERIKREGENYGRGEAKGKIILEHTSANPDGPLHIGHGRNAIIGDSLARILSFYGYDVERQYYLNDMGKQLAIVVFGLERFELDKDKKPDHAIAQVYIKANRLYEESEEAKNRVAELMQRYEAGDEEVVKKFKEAAELALKGIKETLKRLGIFHDTITWESQFVRDGSVHKIVEKLASTEYAKQDGKALMLELKSFGIEKELVLRRSDGTFLYATRDIAHHVWKSSRGKVIDVWGADHKLLAKQISAVLNILGYNEPEFVIYEFITLPSGGMSTRRGVFISMDDLIEESITRAYKEVEKRRQDAGEEFKRKVAEAVGVAAVRFNIVRVAPEKSMVFRWEEALDFERQSAPFLMYAYARARRILDKTSPPESFSIGELSNDERVLIKHLAAFPVAVEEAAQSRKPNLLANYLIELASAFNRFYMNCPVLKSEERDFRLNLVQAFTVVMGKGLDLLGIEALEEM